MSLTRGHSCVLCQQHKIRCNQQKPCANCVRGQVECRVVPAQQLARRKKKLHERDLVERLKKYEELMAQHGINFDLVLSEDGDNEDCVSRSEDSGKKQAACYDEYRTTYDLLYRSSDEKDDRPTAHHAFDTMFGDTDGFPPFVGGSPPTRITHLHPPAIQIFQLWQVPTLLRPRPLEAQMFCIYLIAVKSMTDEEVQTIFGETKTMMLARYSEASKQALINAGFMRSNELMVLQAYLLYLLSVGRNGDPRSLFCFIDIAVRIATRLGLHRDRAQSSLSLFEIEQGRRLWWQIVVLEKRMAEIIGSDITALSSAGTDCRLPLTVNDTELHPHAKNPPNPSTGPTEMSFCLTRIELTIASARGNNNACSLSIGADAGTQAGRLSLYNVDNYCSYMESVYLETCDSKIPIKLLTLLATRASLCKLRITDFIRRGIPTTHLKDRERDALFLCAIQMLEYDDKIYTNKSLRGFLWYTQTHGPLSGYIFLASELRQRTTGEACERAWKAICSNYDHRGFVHKIHNPMHVPFAHAILKAWDARQQAEVQLGRTIEPPNLVNLMRQRLSSSATGPEHGPESVKTGGTTPESWMPSQTERIDHTIFDDLPSLDSPSQMYGATWPECDWTDLTHLMQSGLLESQSLF